MMTPRRELDTHRDYTVIRVALELYQYFREEFGWEPLEALMTESNTFLSDQERYLESLNFRLRAESSREDSVEKHRTLADLAIEIELQKKLVEEVKKLEVELADAMMIRNLKSIVAICAKLQNIPVRTNSDLCTEEDRDIEF